MTRLSSQAEDVLKQAGWYPGRQVPDLVASWKESLMLSDGFEMFQSAESALLEFGGLNIDQDAPGETCAREPFTLDPTLTAHEGDRFSEFASLLNTRLYPLGEAAGGYYFLAISENGHVYLLMQDIRLLGESINEALERLLIGREAKEISL
jgi:hypothetical protein